ncbi:MAG TPA: hypothetical protein VK163_03705 [Opitutaceae bacterium]|nr:hypothetical protein [Opitutaceae bacterium]
MNTQTPLRLLALAAIAGALTTAVVAEPKAGGTVYSKRNGLSLYTAPNSQSAVAGSVGFAEALKISEINPSGKWLNVTAGATTGWVFAGFTAEKKPEDLTRDRLGSVDASSSTTAAAARPLSPEAEQYAARHGKADAGKDVDWVEAEAHKVAPEIVTAYVKENKKGEYQE